MPKLVSEDDIAVDGVFVDLKNQHFAAYQQIAKQYTDAASALPVGNQDRKDLEIAAQSLAGGVAQEINDLYDRAATRVKASNAELRTYWLEYRQAKSDLEREAVAKKILSAMDERQAHISGAFTIFSQDLDKTVAAKPINSAVNASIAVSKAEADAKKSLKQLFNGNGFIDSRYTYYVVKAEEANWAPMFDRTLARGFLGNTDIAIKALGPGNFTIKGLSFNPADIAAAASKVTTQTVLLAAQIAGVPVKVSGAPSAPNTTSAGAALASSSTTFANTLAASATVDEKVRAHRDALLRIAAVILQERSTIVNGTDAERKASLDAIRAIYASHAGRLPITTN